MTFPDTQFLRAIAILVVVNSHLDRYYPVPFLATGGAIGNSLFFFLSAFGIYVSQQNKRKCFKEFIGDRIARIYPSMWIVLLFLVMPLMIASGKLASNTITAFVSDFFAPPYWFLQALLVYCLSTHHVTIVEDVSRRQALILTYLGILCLLYFLFYFTWVDLSTWCVEKTPFDRIHYFMVFLFGIFVASRNESLSYTGFHNYLVLAAILICIYLHKYLIMKGSLLDLQFLQQAAMYPICYFSLKVARSPFIGKRLMRSRNVVGVVDFFSNHTLEIYMIHETLNRPVLNLRLPFPINVILFVGLSIIGAVIAKRVAKVLTGKLSISNVVVPITTK